MANQPNYQKSEGKLHLTETQQESFMFGMMGSLFAGLIVWMIQRATSKKVE